MKKTVSRLALLLFVAAMLQHCVDEGESARPEKVQFVCSFTDTGVESGRSQLTATPTALLLSVINAAGESVFLNKRVELIRMGDSFITEPLEMTPGSYQVSDFMLIDDQAGVIYATPRKGSPLARAVSRPLPSPFSVSKSKVSSIAMEVIDVGARQPEDFGYVSFPIDVVNPLQLSVFVPGNNGATLASAKAYLVEGSDTIKTYNLGATINLISFPGDPQVSRRLIVTKSGYNTVAKEFVYKDLIETLDGLPWKIILVPSLFTLDPVLNFTSGLTYSDMRLAGMPGTLTVDWGDGASETFELTSDDVYLHHEYASEGNFRINVTGDLDKVTEFYQFYGQGQSKAINVQGLTELKDFRFGYTSNRVEVIDLSHNPKVEVLFLGYSELMKKIILADDNVVRYVELTGPVGLSTASMDALIDQIYHAAVVHNTTGATFYAPSHFLPGGDLQMVGPPSPAAIAKLQELRDAYDWNVAPLP